MTRSEEESSANDAAVTRGYRRKRRITKIILITLGILFIPIGIGLFALSLLPSAMYSGLMELRLSYDDVSAEKLAKFRYTSWREPSQNIRPFVQGPKSFEGCKILRYRRGTRLRWLGWLTYYEAEYLMPDGSLVIGPAFGPRPYAAPNIFVLGPLIVAGLIMFVAGIALISDKLAEPELSCGPLPPDCA
ncbi:MAG: hypothetical protein ISS70_04830 [Phycisphaerae bacterium]|nr:hypothetical protein [Phycisphaerae bacterium]